MAKKSNNLVGVTGEYYVCAELGKIGVLEKSQRNSHTYRIHTSYHTNLKCRKSVSVQPKKDLPFCKNLNFNTHPTTDMIKLKITTEIKRHNYLSDKNRQLPILLMASKTIAEATRNH